MGMSLAVLHLLVRACGWLCCLGVGMGMWLAVLHLLVWACGWLCCLGVGMGMWLAVLPRCWYGHVAGCVA